MRIVPFSIFPLMTLYPTTYDFKCIKCHKKIEYALFVTISTAARESRYLLHMHNSCLQTHNLLPDERVSLLINRRIKKHRVLLDYPSIAEKILIGLKLLYLKWTT